MEGGRWKGVSQEVKWTLSVSWSNGNFAAKCVGFYSQEPWHPLDDQSNKRSRQQLSSEGTKQTAPRNELFVQVSQLLGNELHHYDSSLTQLSREVADVFVKEGALKGIPFILNNNGQFCPVSKKSPNWPWHQLLSVLDTINPNYDPDALKKFMGCTHLAMRDTLYNQHHAD